MAKVYVLKSGALIEVFSNRVTAYKAACACFEYPKISYLVGEGKDLEICYTTADLDTFKKELKTKGYCEIEDPEDENSAEVEITTHTIIK